MSAEKYRAEARRWLTQCRADLRAAEASAGSGCFEWACFQAQQSGEKALKAFWYFHGHDPWGHSLVALIQGFPTPEEGLRSFVDSAKQLDKLYIPTRYPNGLPDLTPSEVFTAGEARRAITLARDIVQWVGEQAGRE